MTARRGLIAALLFALLLTGCGRETRTLREAKRGFRTRLVRDETPRSPVPTPPAGVFDLVNYHTAVGDLPAYLTPNARDGGKKRPAIVWITGGDCNSIGEVWGPQDPANDQSAQAFRKAGVVMLFPSLRGGNLNTSRRESFFGEVDDVRAAVAFLMKQPGVDPKRVFLGGHSTGGTLALLAAESDDRFRAVFSFGPVADIGDYGGQFTVCEPTRDELRLRSPGYWLHGVTRPTFVFEGGGEGNGDALRQMQRTNKNPNVHFELIPGHSHFSVLAPTTERLARSVVADTGAGEFAQAP